MFTEEEIKRETRRWYTIWAVFFLAVFLAALPKMINFKKTEPKTHFDQNSKIYETKKAI